MDHEFIMFALLGILQILKGRNRTSDHFIVLFVAFFFFVIEPAFYLFADIEFRRAFEEKGLKKAIILALNQKY